MREDPLWARIALLLNLVGTILFALSFAATSSDFRMVTAHGYDASGRISPNSTLYALCVHNNTLAAADSASGLILGANGCPDEPQSKAVAVVNTEHPRFLYAGLGMSSLGFLIQFLTVPRRKTLAEINEELRRLRKQKRLMEMGAESEPKPRLQAET